MSAEGWKVVVTMKGGKIMEHTCEGYVVTAAPNKRGDLTIYRSHPEMYVVQPIASYAAGEWVSHENV